jgi:hypothetical protein
MEELVLVDMDLPDNLRVDFLKLERKPWNDENADVSDFFNYGRFL